MIRSKVRLLSKSAISVLIFFAGPAFSQDLQFMGSTLWSDFNAVVVEGNYAYCALTPGMAILDISDPGNLGLISEFPTPRQALDIFIRDNYAYLACNHYGLVILDISDLENPSLTGVFERSYYFQKVFVTEDYAYVGSGGDLIILDISDPSDPQYMGTFDESGGIKDIYVEDELAYLAYCNGGLRIVELSDPTNPGMIREMLDGCFNDMFIIGNYAYLSGDGIHILEISDLLNPEYVADYDYGDQTNNIAVVGDFAYMTTNNDLLVFDISDIFDIVLFDTIELFERNSGMFMDGYYLYLANEYSLDIWNVSNPPYPAPYGEYDVKHDVRQTRVQDDYAYVAAGNRLSIVNVSNPYNPYFISEYDQLGYGYPYSVKTLAVEGNYVFINTTVNYDDYDCGLAVLDVSDIIEPVMASSIDTVFDFFISELIYSNSYVYYGGYEYVKIIDVSEPIHPVIIAEFEAPHYGVEDIALSGNYLYIANRDSGLVILDVSDPTVPVRTGRCDVFNEAQGVAIVDNYAIIADRLYGLAIIDISDPYDPEIVADYEMDDQAYDITIDGNYAYVQAGGEAVIFDITDILDPFYVDTYNTPGSCSDIFIVDDLFYVSDMSSLRILGNNLTGLTDGIISTPSIFSLSRNHPNPFNATTTFSYSLPEQSEVTLSIYNILGRRVSTLFDGNKQAGYHTVTWHADHNPSGVYFARLEIGDWSQNIKMVLLK